LERGTEIAGREEKVYLWGRVGISGEFSANIES
jgi:hypothetical protein